MQLYCDRYMCEKVVPGNRVTVIGIYSIKKAGINPLKVCYMMCMINVPSHIILLFVVSISNAATHVFNTLLSKCTSG